MRKTTIFVCVVGAISTACATLPRISAASACEPGGRSAILVRSVDRNGASITYMDVLVESVNKRIRMKSGTSSLGTAQIPLPSGTYSVAVGDEFRRQSAQVHHARTIVHDDAHGDADRTASQSGLVVSTAPRSLYGGDIGEIKRLLAQLR